MHQESSGPQDNPVNNLPMLLALKRYEGHGNRRWQRSAQQCMDGGSEIQNGPTFCHRIQIIMKTKLDTNYAS